MSRRFGPRVPLLVSDRDSTYVVSTEGVAPLSASTYTYEAPYGSFVKNPFVGGFMFGFRQLPYDTLSGFHQEYFDWLSASVRFAAP